MTPDAPLTAAWAATLYHLERALVMGERRAWGWAGFALGLGLLSKYTIALLGGAGLLFVVIDPASRHWLRRREPYAAVLIALSVFMPVIVWNAMHEWASFAFQTSRRLAEAPRFSLHRLLAAALILLTPTGFVAVTCAMIIRRSGDRAGRFLVTAIGVPLAVFAAFSLRHEVKLDWMGAPFTAALPLMAAGLARAGRDPQAGGAARSGRAWLMAWAVTLVAMPLLYAVGWYYLVVGFPGVGYSRHTELLPVAWRQFGGQIDALAAGARARFGDRLLVVGMDRYAIASERAFYSGDPARAVGDTSSWHLFDDTGLMYERWFPRADQVGRPLLLVAFDVTELADRNIGPYVDGLEPVHEAALERRGADVRHYYYRIARHYRYPPAPSPTSARP
jgi:dolichol-phosphate mannosyltransferase